MPHHSWHPNQAHKGPRIILLSQMGECHKTSQVKTSDKGALLETGKSFLACFGVEQPLHSHSHGQPVAEPALFGGISVPCWGYPG